MDKPFATTQAASRRKRFPWNGLLLFVFLLGLYYIATRPSPNLEGWTSDFPAALEEAAATDRMVLVDFYSNSCPYCKKMERRVLTAKPVTTLLERFVRVRVNATQSPDLANRYEVVGLPAFLVLDAKGKVVDQAVGYYPAPDFARFLERVSQSKPE